MTHRRQERARFRRLRPGATVCLGLALLTAAPILLPLALLVALGVIAHRTTPSRLRPPGAKTILAGVAGYPAACATLYFLLRNSDVGVLTLVIFTLPALALGIMIPRLWTLLLPLAAAVLALGVAYHNNPACTSCGDGSGAYATGITALSFVAPSMLMIELGILLRNLLTRVRRARAFAAT